jgi:hypothetical protein
MKRRTKLALALVLGSASALGLAVSTPVGIEAPQVIAEAPVAADQSWSGLCPKDEQRDIEGFLAEVNADPRLQALFPDLKGLRVVKLKTRVEAHVAYTLNGEVYWSARKVTLRVGEGIIVQADGTVLARARCCNPLLATLNKKASTLPLFQEPPDVQEDYEYLVEAPPVGEEPTGIPSWDIPSGDIPWPATTPPVLPVPEVGTFVTMATGLVILFLFRRKLW